ncbi:MAG: metal-dependent hydrolase [Candidatus Heimdallarchaeota archaeon]|nr:metal-dependent hydrolase [Candidatus Heimdallarchaeota archaeon]
MDPITHVMIAYSFVAWINKSRKIPYKILVPYLIGSVIPDLDYVFNPLVYFAPKLYWLEHRGMAHSFIGVIPYVLLAAVILNIPKLKNKIWKDEQYLELKFLSWIGLLSLYLGTLTHLLTDFFVPTGEMILFPFSFDWYGLKILSTNNIHSLAALIAAVSIIPLNWNKRRRNAALLFFMVTFSFYSSARIAVNIRANNTFKEKYGEGFYSSNELVFTYNINYKVMNSTNLNNRTYIIAIIDGMAQKFIHEEIIPEVRIFGNSTQIIHGLMLVNLTKKNNHYYRLWQKNRIVCVEAEKDSATSWVIRWFAPIREAEEQIIIGNLDFKSTTEVVFHIQDNGLITKIVRPISV